MSTCDDGLGGIGRIFNPLRKEPVITSEVGGRLRPTVVTPSGGSQAAIHPCNDGIGSKKGKLGAHAVKRVAAGAHLLNPWLFEPAKRPDDRADYCLDCSFLPQWNRVLDFTLEWSGMRPTKNDE